MILTFMSCDFKKISDLLIKPTNTNFFVMYPAWTSRWFHEDIFKIESVTVTPEIVHAGKK